MTIGAGADPICLQWEKMSQSEPVPTQYVSNGQTCLSQRRGRPSLQWAKTPPPIEPPCDSSQLYHNYDYHEPEVNIMKSQYESSIRQHIALFA